MGSDYYSSLNYLAQKRYLEKCRIEGVTLPDPYGVKDENWSEDLSLCPDLQFGDIYTYLIETKGQYTRILRRVNRWKPITTSTMAMLGRFIVIHMTDMSL